MMMWKQGSLSISMTLCEGNPSVTGGFHSQRANNILLHFNLFCFIFHRQSTSNSNTWMLSMHPIADTTAWPYSMAIPETVPRTVRRSVAPTRPRLRLKVTWLPLFSFPMTSIATPVLVWRMLWRAWPRRSQPRPLHQRPQLRHQLQPLRHQLQLVRHQLQLQRHQLRLLRRQQRCLAAPILHCVAPGFYQEPVGQLVHPIIQTTTPSTPLVPGLSKQTATRYLSCNFSVLPHWPLGNVLVI